MADAKVLTSADAIPNHTSPTGVVYKAFREGEPTLWSIYATRKDEEDKVLPDKNRKQPVDGTFTTEQRAYEALRRWLSARWAESDEESARRKAKQAA